MAVSRTVKLEGLNEVLKNLGQYGENLKRGATAALLEEAHAIEQASATRYVPVDTGQLRESSRVEAGTQGDVISASIVYPGPYAAAVHENPRAGRTGGVSPSGKKYKHWATTGQYKFLETAVLEAEPGMAGRIADRIRSILGKG